MAASTISREDVFQMDFNQLCDTLETNNIDYSCLEDIEDIRDLVLQSVCCLESSNKEETSREPAAIEVIGRVLERDTKIKRMISDLYDSVLTMSKMKNFEKFLDSETSVNIAIVDTYKKQLERKEYPIVVAGETSAGKSSLLNLIMGEHMLPREILSSTSCICRIFNSEQKKAVVIDESGRKFEINDVRKETLSKYVCIDRSENKTRRYRTVDIYWPVPMLKEYATIVDTPGVGESDEMTTKVLEYLPEALAFIYVINTANAGGVQEDRLIKILKKQLELAERGLCHIFDPECVIFVCNKWDQVPVKEEENVWNDIAKKLQTCWPTGMNVDIRKQMFKMSVTKDLQRKETGLGYSDNFKALITGIDLLISNCLEQRVKKHAEMLQMILQRLLMKATASLNASRNGLKEKEEMKKETEKRLTFVKNETEEVKMKFESKAEKKCRQIAAEFVSHLKNKETKRKIFDWHADEFPDCADYDVTEYLAKQMIVDKINNHLIKWCSSRHIEDTFYQMFDLFIKECKIIRSNFIEINQIIQGIKPPNSYETFQPKKETASDFDFFLLNMNFPTESKIIFFATAPVWIPLIVVASVVVVMPVAIATVIRNTVVEKKKIKRYRENKFEHMSKLAEEEIKKYNADVMYDVLRKAYLTRFMSCLKEVCEQIIPKQIKADKELVEKILKEDRDYQTLKSEYAPIERKCKEIVGNLLYVEIKYLSDCQPRIMNEHTILGRGVFGHVNLCDVDIGGNKVKCAVRRLASSTQPVLFHQLWLAEKLMKFHHPNIVRYDGISIESTHNQNENLVIFMEVCEYSLADVFLCDKHPVVMCQCDSHRKQTCHSFSEKARNCMEYMDAFKFFTESLKDILNGLVYLHEIGCTHRGLKLSNILVKGGKAKLADIGMSELENLSKGIIFERPMYTAPEVLNGGTYGLPADIFSLAIIAWEMWYGRRVFSESFYSDVINDYSSIKKHVLSGTRPKLDQTSAPPAYIQRIIEKCWVEEAAKRPTARQLIRYFEVAEPI